MVKENAVVIDVGINRVKDETKKSGYALTGDVDFENVAPKCRLYYPGSRWCRINDHCSIIDAIPIMHV